jgi:hypothetical protein
MRLLDYLGDARPDSISELLSSRERWKDGLRRQFGVGGKFIVLVLGQRSAK